MKILFVCRGNVARSQMSEMFLKSALKDKIEVISAGTALSGKEQPIGELTPAIDNTITVMKEVGIDMSNNIRKNITKEMADSADRIFLVVDARDPIPDYLIDNPKVTHWDILDPKGQNIEFTRDVRDQIKKKVDDLVLELGV